MEVNPAVNKIISDSQNSSDHKGFELFTVSLPAQILRRLTEWTEILFSE